MSEYRHRTTGEVKTQGQWRAANPNMSLPRVWKQATLDALNLDPVLKSPAATVGKYQVSVRAGVEQDANGNWVEKYIARDMFQDTTAEDGTVTTKAENEAAYQANMDAQAAEVNRNVRDKKLVESDWTQSRDVLLDNDADWKTYRQALRDITSHANWPHLNEADWPEKPV